MFYLFHTAWNSKHSNNVMVEIDYKSCESVYVVHWIKYSEFMSEHFEQFECVSFKAG